jgi:hypothetical protein
MAQQEVKIAFKVEGVDGYITDLNELQTALSKTANDTEELNDATEDLNDNLDKSKSSSKSFGKALGEAPGPVGKVTQGIKGLGVALKALLANPVVLVITAIVAALTALFKAFTSTKEGAEAFDRVLAGLSAAVDVIRDRVLVFASAIGKFFSGDFTGAFETAKEAVSGIGDEIVAEAQKAAELTGALQRNTDALRELDVERAEQNTLLAEQKKIIDDTSLSIEERSAALEKASTAEQELLNKELQLQQERLSALEALAEQSDSDAETLDELAQQRILIAQLEEQSLNKQTELLGKRKALEAEQAAIDKAAADERKRIREEEEAAAAKQLENEAAIAEELRRRKLNEQQLELDDLRIKYEEQVKLAGKNEKLIADLKTQYDADVAASKKKFDDERIAAEEATQKTIKDVLDKYAEVKYATEEQRILAELEQKYIADRAILEAEGATKEQLAQLDKAYQDKVTAQTKKGEQDRAQLRRASVQQAGQLANDLFAGFKALNEAQTADDEKQAKRQFEINKAFSISQAVINTALAVSDVLAQEKTGVIGKTIAAVAIAAQGIAQVLNIKKQQFDTGGSTASIEQPTFDPQAALNARREQATGLQDAGAELSLAGQPEAPPIRAYVVATEVTSQQEANNQVENLSKL